MKDVECPYCGEWQEINHDDGYGYEEDGTYEQECGDCEKTFVYTTCITFDYTVGKADCLNGAKHKYKPTHTFPKEASKMYCVDCDHRRLPTEQELKDIMEES